MIRRYLIHFILFLGVFFSAFTLNAATVLNAEWKDVIRGNCSDQNSGWWSSSEAIRIAENVLLYQREIGGWPKNTKMQLILSQEEKDALIEDKPRNRDCTIDNGAVDYELTYLSKVYKAISDEEMKAKIKAGFQLGVQYLLKAQYDNGGWPQFYPYRGGYSNYITYNDDAMINVMEILEHIYTSDNTFSIQVADSTKTQAEQAFYKGIDCILKTQYAQDGVLTVWCAQHDEETLEPVMARSYELASLSGQESASILRFLMGLNNPSKAVRRAVYSGVKWYEDVKITGKRLEHYTNSDGLNDLRVVDDANASPLWARFYTLENNRPFFCDRDGIMKFSLAEIGYERRNGYSWYNTSGNSVASAAYSWFNKWSTTLLASPYQDQVVTTTDTIGVRAFANDISGKDFIRFELTVDTNTLYSYDNMLIDTVFSGLDTGMHSMFVKAVYAGNYVETDSAVFKVVRPIHKLTVYSGSGDGEYSYGSEVTITAKDPRAGEVFDKWIWFTDDTAYIENLYEPVTTVIIPDYDIKLKATFKENTAIEIKKSEYQLLVCYPNPVQSQLTVEISKDIMKLDIFNLTGERVKSMSVQGKKSVTINVEDLPEGNYIIKGFTKTLRTTTGRFSKQ